MTSLPVIGAALTNAELMIWRDLILEKDRDLELQSFCSVAARDDDWQPLADQVKALLVGYNGRHWAIGDGNILWTSVFAAIGELAVKPRLILELRDKSGIPASMAFLAAKGLGQ